MKNPLLALLFSTLLAGCSDGSSARDLPEYQLGEGGAPQASVSCVYTLLRGVSCSFDPGTSWDDPEEKCQDGSACPVEIEIIEGEGACHATNVVSKEHTYAGSCAQYWDARSRGELPPSACSSTMVDTGGGSCDRCLAEFCCDSLQEAPTPEQLGPYRTCARGCWKAYPLRFPTIMYSESDRIDLNEDDRQPCMDDCEEQRSCYAEVSRDIESCQLSNCHTECRYAPAKF